MVLEVRRRHAGRGERVLPPAGLQVVDVARGQGAGAEEGVLALPAPERARSARQDDGGVAAKHRLSFVLRGPGADWGPREGLVEAGVARAVGFFGDFAPQAGQS